MAKREKTQEKSDGGVLVNAAKVIGHAAGKIASLAGAEATPALKKPKLQKKSKSRLPRRAKKAQKKAANTGRER